LPVGWSDCGHGTWRPGRVLDPFAGTGTTLAGAVGLESVGIDIDTRNALLAIERVGMFLDIVWTDPDYTLTTLPCGNPTPGAYDAWLTDQDAARILDGFVDLFHSPAGRPVAVAVPIRTSRPATVIPGQADLFGEEATA
jgi:hypothetical protein